MNSDGSNQEQITRGRGETEASMTPDGQWVIYSEEGQATKSLWKVPIEGTTSPAQLTNQIASAATVSPDGKLIACLLFDPQDKRKKLALISFDDGHIIKFFETKDCPDLISFDGYPMVRQSLLLPLLMASEISGNNRSTEETPNKSRIIMMT